MQTASFVAPHAGHSLHVGFPMHAHTRFSSCAFHHRSCVPLAGSVRMLSPIPQTPLLPCKPSRRGMRSALTSSQSKHFEPRNKKFFPAVSVLLIILNVALALETLSGRGVLGSRYLHMYAIVPEKLVLAPMEEAQRVVIGQLLHGNWWHLGFNMLALLQSGPELERRVGSLRFALIILLLLPLTALAQAAVCLLFNLAASQLFGLVDLGARRSGAANLLGVFDQGNFNSYSASMQPGAESWWGRFLLRQSSTTTNSIGFSGILFGLDSLLNRGSSLPILYNIAMVQLVAEAVSLPISLSGHLGGALAAASLRGYRMLFLIPAGGVLLYAGKHAMLSRLGHGLNWQVGLSAAEQMLQQLWSRQASVLWALPACVFVVTLQKILNALLARTRGAPDGRRGGSGPG